MGNGAVLEAGTHDELLAEVNGPYARLVKAQKLRGSSNRQADDEAEGETSLAIEKEAAEEVPLGRANTGHSLASDLAAQKQRQKEEQKERQYSMPYLFYRMGRINKENARHYVFGFIAACSEYFLPRHVVLITDDFSFSDWVDLARFRNCIRCVIWYVFCRSPYTDVELQARL